MIAIVQLIFTALLAIWYAIELVDFTSWLSILGLLGFYIGINVLFTILVILLFVAIAYITKNTDPKSVKKHNILMHFSNYFFYSILRVKVKVKGLENLPKNSNFVMYANHIEYNDPLYIKRYYHNTSLAFIAKEPLFKIPVLRTVLKSVGCIPIGPNADRSSLEAILKGIKRVKDGQPMGLFPEGKRSYSNNMNEFKPGAFKVATKAKADISLVVLYNFHEINVNKFRIKKVKAYMTILPIIPYETIKDMDTVSISKMAFDLINKELDNYKSKAKKD